MVVFLGFGVSWATFLVSPFNNKAESDHKITVNESALSKGFALWVFLWLKSNLFHFKMGRVYDSLI